jgi:hypothetical protein
VKVDKTERQEVRLWKGVLATIGIVAGWVLLTALTASASGQQVWSASYPLSSSGELVLENIHGQILIEAWDRAEVEITALKSTTGNALDLDGVQVKVDAQPARLVLRTFYLGQTEAPVRVDYRLRVPRQVRVENAATVEGDIYFSQLEGTLQAHTLNGNITGAALGGAVAFKATNGDVSVAFRGLPAEGETVRLETLNGNIHLTLPEKADADLAMQTVAGKIETPGVLPAKANPADRVVRLRAGRGGTEILLRTVRGNISVTEQEEEF